MDNVGHAALSNETPGNRGGLVPVFVANGVRTSAGPGPGVKHLPPDEAGRLVGAKYATYGTAAPRGYEDGGALPAEPNMMPQGG